MCCATKLWGFVWTWMGIAAAATSFTCAAWSESKAGMAGMAPGWRQVQWCVGVNRESKKRLKTGFEPGANGISPGLQADIMFCCWFCPNKITSEVRLYPYWGLEPPYQVGYEPPNNALNLDHSFGTNGSDPAMWFKDHFSENISM